MNTIIRKIKDETLKRLAKNRMDKRETLLYVDHKVFNQEDKLDIILDKISFERPTYLVFVDEAPGMNWAHPCHYLLYDAKNGELLKQVNAEFPYFMEQRAPKTLEVFKTCRTIEGYRKKKSIRVPLEPAKLSAWRKFAKLPLIFPGQGHRYAIFYSGHSNCRHVNDMEFLYRTLIDVYGYDPNDIYVLNYDGTLNWNPASWGTFTEPAAPCNFPVDNTPFRIQINAQGNRAGFQNVINNIAGRIKSNDCLFIHTNNHGGWNHTRNEGFMSGWGGSYYANDFANDLAQLPKFRTLLVMMEPCHAGAFNNPIIMNSPADRTVVQAAVPWDENSAGGWFFDPWAEMWISAIAGVRGDGSALAVSADDNLDTLISAWEAFDYALHIDNPVMNESSTDLSKNIFLSKCGIFLKLLKEYKEFDKIYKEFDKIKDIKEFDKVKDFVEHGKMVESGYVGIHQREDMTELQRTQELAQAAGHDLGTRISRLETLIEQLTPFIESRLRPEMKGGAYKVKKKEE